MPAVVASQSEPNSTLGSSRFPHAYPPLARCFRSDDSGLRVAQPSNRQWSKGDWARSHCADVGAAQEHGWRRIGGDRRHQALPHTQADDGGAAAVDGDVLFPATILEVARIERAELIHAHSPILV